MTKLLMTAAGTAFLTAALASAGSTGAKAGPVCISDITPPGMYRSCEYLSFRECRRNAVRGGGACDRHRYVNDGGYLDGPTFGPMVLYDQSYTAPVYYSGAYIRALY
ncbi:MAG: hypothetical protein K2X60_05030 [Xanthobacteraceae bacterium]|nr:hypothetical protein [Xanthobacteraceae bacterium]